MPEQKVVGPFGVMIAAAGKGLTTILVGPPIAEHPLASVTVIEYVEVVVARTVEFDVPLLQELPVK